MKKGFKTGLAKVMSLTMLSSLALGFSPRGAYAEENLNNLLNAPLSAEAKKEILNQIAPMLNKSNLEIKDTRDPNEVVRVIVEVAGQCSTEMVAKGEKPTEDQINNIKQSQAPIKENAKELEDANILHSYTNVMNGFSMDVKRSEISKIESMSGVKNVVEATKYTEDMNSARKLTQAEETWENYSLKGEGQVVSIIDTGIDFNNKAFKAPDDTSKLKLNKESVDEVKATGALHANKNADTYFSEKIPFGFNYADNNTEIIDKRDGKDPHGCHVAGITAADGDENEVKENKSIKGVAPEAQLLAMKVFSNGPGPSGAFSDSIIAAIDDSVVLGADVINMSLGSPAGFQRNTDPEQIAIKRAADAGIMVVVSAGNSYYSTYPTPVPELNDIATAGSPAMAKDAFMVSNFQNSSVTAKKINLKDDKGNVTINTIYAEHQFDIKDIANKDYEILECGLGRESDFEGKDIKGKVALIQRGENAFIEKIVNAQEAGAVGVIIYNKNGDDTLINMATDPNIKIPAIFVPNSTGASIKDATSKGTKVLLNCDFSSDIVDNLEAGEYDDSTSWGPGPGLEFKPQIAAPGGNIYSTLNNNEFGTMSGTSMAAPHVSGASALLLQGLNESIPEVKGRDKIELAKNIFMNTSSVKGDKYNEGTPVSPRRQGSGLIQIEDAVKNRVTATYKGEASVALKEFSDNKVTFTLELKNFGDSEASYKLDNIGGILTQDSENAPKNMICDTKLDKEEANISFNKESVTVAPKGTETVDVTLNIDSNLSKDRFLEGYVNFESDDKNVPSLVVPFMGFYGDWAKESIATNAIWEKDLHPFLNALKESGQDISYLQNLAVSVDQNREIVLGQRDKETGIVDSETIAISPNDDKSMDKLIPGLYLMRNAKTIEGEIFNEKGESIRKIGKINDTNKNIFNSADGSGKEANVIRSIAWDGKVYNNSTGKFEAAPEGKYTYKVNMYIDYEGSKAQTLEIPVKVDVTGPEVTIKQYEKVTDSEYKVYFNMKDESSGINLDETIPVLVNGKLDKEATKQKAEYDKEKDCYYKIVKNLKDNCINEIAIGAYDNAMNLGGSMIGIKIGEVEPAVITFDENSIDKKQEININSKELTITGKISRKIASFEINGKEVELGAPDINGNIPFVSYVNVEEGTNTVNIKAVDLDGKELMNYGVKVRCDVTKPEIQIDSHKIENGKLYAYGESNIVLKGKVTDNVYGYCFYSNGQLIKDNVFGEDVGPDKNAYNFELNYDNVNNGDKIVLKAVDRMNNTTELVLTVVK